MLNSLQMKVWFILKTKVSQLPTFALTASRRLLVKACTTLFWQPEKPYWYIKVHSWTKKVLKLPSLVKRLEFALILKVLTLLVASISLMNSLIIWPQEQSQMKRELSKNLVWLNCKMQNLICWRTFSTSPLSNFVKHQRYWSNWNSQGVSSYQSMVLKPSSKASRTCNISMSITFQ